MPDIGQREDRLTAIAFTTRHSGDGPGRRDSGLGGVTDAVFLKPFQNVIPIHQRTTPIALVRYKGLRRGPMQILRVVDTSFNGREGAAFVCKGHTGPHGMVAYKFHHLSAKLPPLQGTIAHTDMIHQVGQAHDAQTDTAGSLSGFLQLGDGRNIGVDIDHIIQEAGRKFHSGAQVFPGNRSIRTAIFCQIDGTQAAILVRSKPLFSARIGGFQRIQMRNRI